MSGGEALFLLFINSLKPNKTVEQIELLRERQEAFRSRQIDFLNQQLHELELRIGSLVTAGPIKRLQFEIDTLQKDIKEWENMYPSEIQDYITMTDRYMESVIL
jgi:hypothetical protein